MVVQKFCPFFIIFNLIRQAVNASVQFNDELIFYAEEIQNEMLVRMLSPKF